MQDTTIARLVERNCKAAQTIHALQRAESDEQEAGR